ncbi:MAG: ROK family protein [Nitrososphaerota archaeon]|nr:ROK family protein [Aigarchaeota archaeon]MDW8076154.1 ROK family protein [Nitrososphaerota archaeon]
MRELILAADIGGTMIRVAIADSRGRILEKASTLVPKGPDARAVPMKVLELCDVLSAKYGGRRSISKVSIAAIGPLDMTKGAIVRPANMPYEIVPIMDVLCNHFDATFILLNDCNAAVIAEKNIGAGKGVDDVVYITISSGIGGGVILDGRLLLGKDGNAAEIGHTVVDMSMGMMCGCGKKGHWEAYCGGNSIPKFAKFLLEKKYSNVNSALAHRLRDDTHTISAKDIFDYARAGDEFALMFVDAIAEINGAGVANVVDVFDPSVISIGGSVALNNVDLVVDKLRPFVEQYALNRVPKIVPTPLGHDAPLIGAILAAIEPPPKSIFKTL